MRWKPVSLRRSSSTLRVWVAWYRLRAVAIQTMSPSALNAKISLASSRKYSAPPLPTIFKRCPGTLYGRTGVLTTGHAADPTRQSSRRQRRQSDHRPDDEMHEPHADAHSHAVLHRSLRQRQNRKQGIVACRALGSKGTTVWSWTTRADLEVCPTYSPDLRNWKKCGIAR